jgi:hypothetical protein
MSTSAAGQERSSWAMRLVGVVGLLLTGSIVAVVLAVFVLGFVLGLLVLLMSPSLWASFLGG